MKAEYFSPEPVVIGNVLQEMRAVEEHAAVMNLRLGLFMQPYAARNKDSSLLLATNRLYERLHEISDENLDVFETEQNDYWLKLNVTALGGQTDPDVGRFHRDFFPQILSGSNTLQLTRWACGTFYYDDELMDLLKVDASPHLNRIIVNALIRGQMHLPVIYPGDVVYDSGATYHIPPYNNTQTEQRRLFARVDLPS